jgi:hypothetical protein
MLVERALRSSAASGFELDFELDSSVSRSWRFELVVVRAAARPIRPNCAARRASLSLLCASSAFSGLPSAFSSVSFAPFFVSGVSAGARRREKQKGREGRRGGRGEEN